MAQQQFGNAFPGPSYTRSGFIADQEILYSTNPGSYLQKGVTLAPGQGKLLRGTLLKRNDTTKFYEKATSAGTAEGILRATTETNVDPEGPTVQANILFAGILFLSKLKDANSGITFGSAVLGGRADEDRDFFKF